MTKSHLYQHHQEEFWKGVETPETHLDPPLGCFPRRTCIALGYILTLYLQLLLHHNYFTAINTVILHLSKCSWGQQGILRHNWCEQQKLKCWWWNVMGSRKHQNSQPYIRVLQYTAHQSHTIPSLQSIIRRLCSINHGAKCPNHHCCLCGNSSICAKFHDVPLELCYLIVSVYMQVLHRNN